MKESLNNFDSEVIIVKRDGRKEPFSKDKLYNVCLWACDGNEVLTDILIKDTYVKLHKEVKITDMYEQLINTANSKISLLYPQWQFISAKLYLLDIYKETWEIKDKFYPHLSEVIAKGVLHKTYERGWLESFSEDEINELSNHIVRERDYLFTYKGLLNFFGKYCLNYSKTKKLELPQHTYMRVAMFLGHKESNRMEYIKAVYDDISTQQYTVATPIMLNAGIPNGQLSSCVLSTMDDDTHSIMETSKNIAVYSKFKGGTACDVSRLRAAGSYVSGNQGESSGAVPFIKILESTISGFDQGGKRQGACAVTYPWWHYDFFDLVVLKSNGGTDENRARKLKYSVKINDLLVERYINNENITLFDPKEVPELFGKVGNEFKKTYEMYESRTNIKKRVFLARELMFKLAKERLETGNIYLFHEENVNISSMLGRYVGSSNLCVAGDTTILTKEYGVVPIELVAGRILDIWNGFEWSTSPIFQTSKGQKLLKVVVASELNDTKYTLFCTEYHRWKLLTAEFVETKGLKVGDKLASFFLPDRSSRETLYVDSIEECEGLYPTYCCHEPKRHTAIFNGIMTGQCVEITLPSRPSIVKEERLLYTDKGVEIQKTYEAGEIALCNLSSINLSEWWFKSDEEKFAICQRVVRNLDNTVDLAYYPVKEAEYSNKKYRYLGIGVLNFANLLAKLGISFDSRDALELTDEVFEQIHYYCIKASALLAKELGRFQAFYETKWANGKLPYDMRNKNVDVLTDFKVNEDKLAELRELVSMYGIRNASLFAIAPTATSGTVISATESIEPVLDYMYKDEGTTNVVSVVKDFSECGSKYTKAFDCDPYSLVELASVRQKWLDQSQSVSIYDFNPESAKENINLILYGFKYGMKTFYYHNPKRGMAEDICPSCT